MLGKRPFQYLHCCRSFKYKAGLDLHNEFEDQLKAADIQASKKLQSFELQSVLRFGNLLT